MANKLDQSCRLVVINAAVWSLIDEYVSGHARHPQGNELPDFFDSFGGNRAEICRILDARNLGLPWPFSSQLIHYCNFWVDLHRNVQYEKLPRSRRPPRDAT